MHSYVKCAYDVTRKFPKEEIYSSVSQLRRSAMSVILNYVEGYGRRRDKVKLNFYEMSYGSLNESKYIFYFALDENWIEHKDYKIALGIGEEIGAMLWSEIKSVEKNIN